MKPKLTKNNYYSVEANQYYFSASQIKTFMECPARAVAEIRGDYKRPETVSLLVGSYVDAYFTDPAAFKIFGERHPEVFNTRTGGLKSEFKRANEMIDRARRDRLFCEFLRGRKQKILTGEIFGFSFRSKLDVYRRGERIVDLKTAKDMAPMYVKGAGRVSFAEAWHWTTQAAIYQAIEGNTLPVYLAVITKEDPPDIAVIQIPQSHMNAEMEILRDSLPRYDAMKQGIIPPERCGCCEYCRATNRLERAIMLDEMEDF